jgi:hypothetical protein
VEIQLVLRCLDFRSRLVAARCSKQLHAAASQPFAWPQEEMLTFRVPHTASSLLAFGERLRVSRFHLSPIDLRLLLPEKFIRPLCPELFEVPNVHAITVRPDQIISSGANEFLLPLLRHPSARLLRSIDVPCYFDCPSAADLQQLRTLQHLHSLSVHCSPDTFSTLQQLPLFPSLTHLTTFGPIVGAVLSASLVRCTHLTSLQLVGVIVTPELAARLAELPSLQRLQLQASNVAVQPGQAWTALHSLREIQLDEIRQAKRLLVVLPFFPALRVLRWRCRSPRSLQPSFNPVVVPQLEILRSLLIEMPQLEVQLLLPSTFEEWSEEAKVIADDRLTSHQRRVWTELQQLPAQLPPHRVRIVAVERDADDWRAGSTLRRT